MQALLKIAFFLLIIFSTFWTLIPWRFGIHNYAKSHGRFATAVARVSWVMLLLGHPVLMYAVYFHDVSYWAILLLLGGHIMFHKLFGRDVGAA